ncbi:hypothetical protein EDB92DRAFT_1855877 [Lactarius akahatsu]|uniref:Uncharacterized protein n=1 Tax=Lactarius akahatsu TaxID=416441 RepID=A0AAD4LJ02_9AGAM|nr:hypothetical protein EDB92DRAFT_1855877 [Lactarius akahatsu]
MRSHDPTLPSISFVLSQARPAAPRGSRRWNRFGVRRSKSTPSFAPHPPRYPPRLDSDFLTTVDYRYSSPPRAPSRSSFALPKDIFDADAEIEIIVPSSTESEPSTESATGCSTTSHTCTYYAQHDGSHTHAKNSRSHHGHSLGPSQSLCCGHGSRPRRTRAVTAFIHVSLSAPRITKLVSRLFYWVLNRWGGVSPSRFLGHPFCAPQ